MKRKKSREIEKKSGKEVVVEREVEKHFLGRKSKVTNDVEVKGYAIDQFIDKN